MIRRPLESSRGPFASVLAVAALFCGLAGCAQVLGLEPWTDPTNAAGSGGGGGSADIDGTSATSATSATSTGESSSATSSSSAGAGGCGAIGADPTCNDCMKNGAETDLDCGGDTCAPCGAQGGCTSNSDCLSGKCLMTRCEFGIAGTPCRHPEDCFSAVCDASASEPTCQ